MPVERHNDIPNLPIKQILPTRIEQKAGNCYPLLDAAYSHYVAWLGKHPRMTFFPEYTDHGIQHLLRVAHLAEFLICTGGFGRPNSWDVTSAEDVFVLTGAVLYHDMGMFLTQAAFAELIDGAARPLIDKALDQPWHALWEMYLEESRHWGERTIRRLFGELPWSHSKSTQHLTHIVRCNEPLTECQTLLIGEFIRRHHHRLAHEIACYGWPGNDGPQLIVSDSSMVSPELRDLIGLVSRSHGMQLRDTFGYLSRHHSNNLRESRGTHVVYLMAVLRVADVLHVHAERAAGSRALIQKLASPYSRREQESHQAIFDVRLNVDEDPEAVCIDVQPSEVFIASTLFRLRQWHEMLQSELDHGWTVLGEVYGRYDRLSRLWLSLRRVKSNLYDQSFESKLTFVPCRAAFDTAQGEYLKLLVKPLYGDSPGIGVRELLQNALDAVRERRALSFESKSSFAPIDSRFPNADVILAECSRDEKTPTPENGGPPSDWLHWFEVADRGIGMTAEIVRDFFLKAGATYRRSSDWQKLFTDANGHSKVLRSGRFGVGALAAFLLGEQLQVITRHYSSARAIQFTARLEDESIDLFHARREIGTTVRVRLSAPLGDSSRFEWNWYRLSDPVVKRLRNGEDTDRSGDFNDHNDNWLPSEGATLPLKWRRITYQPFTDIQWTYEEYGTTLTCNGITIGDMERDRGVKWHTLSTNGKTHLGSDKSTEESLCLKVPSVSIFDPDGALPLTLTRDRLATEMYPFSKPLLEAVMRDMLAYALVYGPTKRLTGSSHAYYRGLRYPGYTPGTDRIEVAQWASLPQGFTLSWISMLRWAGIHRCIILASRRNGRILPSLRTDENTALIAVKTDVDPQYRDAFWPLDDRVPLLSVPLRIHSPFPDEAILLKSRVLIGDNVKEFLEARTAEFKRREYLPDDDLETISQVPPGIERTQAERLTPLLNGRMFLVESRSDTSHGEPDLLKACAAWFEQQRTRIEEAGIVCEWFLDPGGRSNENAVVALWRDIIGQPVIPYAMSDRRKQLGRAFEELAAEVEVWERQKLSENEEKAAKLAKRPQGAYPHFLHQQEIKNYLREHNVHRPIRVSKHGDWLTRATGKIGFGLYVPYSREELTAVNPATPQTGNPFKGVEHDQDLLPEFRLIERLLDGSNAAHPIVLGPQRE